MKVGRGMMNKSPFDYSVPSKQWWHDVWWVCTAFLPCCISLEVCRRFIFFIINWIQCGDMVWVTKCIFIITKMSKGRSHGYFLLIILGSVTPKWEKFQRACEDVHVFTHVIDVYTECFQRQGKLAARLLSSRETGPSQMEVNGPWRYQIIIGCLPCFAKQCVCQPLRGGGGN